MAGDVIGQAARFARIGISDDIDSLDELRPTSRCLERECIEKVGLNRRNVA
jgi:hypothetical protein